VHLFPQPKDARTSDTGIDIMENIWCISFLTALIFSGLGAILWKFILNIRPGNLFLYWITTTCAGTLLNAVATFPMHDQGFIFVAFLPLIMYGSKTFKSDNEDQAVVLFIAGVVCILICAMFPFMMPCLIEKTVVEYEFTYWKVVFFISFSGCIYAYGAIYYMRAARRSYER